jgi:hypothetical protein
MFIRDVEWEREEKYHATTSSLGFRVWTRRRVMARIEIKVGWNRHLHAQDWTCRECETMGCIFRRKDRAQGRYRGIGFDGWNEELIKGGTKLKGGLDN